MTRFWWSRERKHLVTERGGVFKRVVPMGDVKARMPIPFTVLAPHKDGGALVGFGPVERRITLQSYDETPSAPAWIEISDNEVVKLLLGQASRPGLFKTLKKVLDAARTAREVGSRIGEGIERVLDVLEQTSQPR